MKKRVLALGLAMMFLFAGCAKEEVRATPAPTPEASDSPTPAPSDNAGRETVNFAVIKGPSGVGAAKLIADSEAETTKNHYAVTIAAANDEVVAGLTRTDDPIDIAAVASNVAANLYQKTDGAVQAIAVSGLGVLYILENGDSVNSIADLKGKTLYATGQGANPEFVLRYLLTENGVDPDQVDIQWRAADEITALMASGEAELCMLPVPAATGVLMKNTGVREALDLSAEWDALGNGSQLTMTTLVVRTAFAQEHPQAVRDFLAEYGESVDYVNQNAAEAAELVAEYGITPNAKIAEAAIPKCSLVCITGADEMKGAIQGYYEVLWAADPQSIGGGMPDDGFYWE